MNVAPRPESQGTEGRPLRAWLLTAVLIAVIACAALAATVAGVTPARATGWSMLGAQATPVACDALDELSLPEVTQITAELDTDGTAAGQNNLPAFCRVALTVAPQVKIEVWLPTQATYNSRFQAVGGGGYAGSISFGAMANTLRNGYATASTDTGHSSPGGGFALNPNGTLNWQLIEDFASRSLIELTKKAKTLIDAFYGQPATYSYWNGCSTGGRQGLMLAQRFPEGYDGILAGAPAINWDRFIPAELWPQVVMQRELGGPIAQCKLGVASQAAVAACDGLDGVVDGVLDDPRRCEFDPSTLVGTVTPCGTFTAADARAIQMIWDGPRGTDGSFLWYGLATGAPLNFLAGTFPFPIATDHFRYWIKQNPAFDWKTLDYAGFEQSFRASQLLFNDVIGTDNPDLSGFRDAGGKVLMWHGWNDQLIFPEGAIDYYKRVIDTFHSTTEVQRFARLFMAPGVFHCGGGTGPQVFDMFSALVRWVENGEAPERIIAARVESGMTVRTRPLCAYPNKARYDGEGDPTSAASFKCNPADLTRETSAIIAANPGTPLADKLEDVLEKLESALGKLDSGDRQGAFGELEGAVGDLESAAKDFPSFTETANDLMDEITATARLLVEEAIDEAELRGGDSGKIDEAEDARDEGDAKRSSGQYKDAVAKYKDAVAKAEDA